MPNLTLTLRFYVSLNTKQVIWETLFPANLLASTEETKSITTKINIHTERKKQHKIN